MKELPPVLLLGLIVQYLHEVCPAISLETRDYLAVIRQNEHYNMRSASYTCLNPLNWGYNSPSVVLKFFGKSAENCPDHNLRTRAENRALT